MKASLFRIRYKLIFTLGMILCNLNLGFSQQFYIHENGLSTLNFSDKHDFKVGVHTPSPEHGMKLLMGYSPLKHLSISGGLMTVNRERKLSEITQKYDGYLYTLAIGAYYPIKKTQENNKVKELLLISRIGYSKGGIDSSNEIYETNFEFQKIYLQMGVGYSVHAFGFNFFMKYNHITYVDGEVSWFQQYPELLDKVERFSENKHFDSMEFKFQFLAGKGFLKGVLGGVLETSLSNNFSSGFLETGKPFLGVVLEIDKLRKRKK